MKQILRKTFLTLLGGLFLNVAAWGEYLTTIGNTDNTTTYLGAQNRYTLAPNKTLTLTFTNYTCATNNWNNWDVIVLAKDQVFSTEDVNNTCYARYRADNWGDGPCFDSSYRGCNWNWTTFGTHVNGATIVLTIEREGSTVKYRAVATKDATSYEQNYRSYNVGDGTQDIDVILTVDLSYIVFANATAAAGTITDTNTDTNHEIVGNRDNTSFGAMQLSKMYVLAAGESMKLSFKNYSSKAQNYYNWVVNVTNDVERYGGDTFTHYIALRADNWENIQNANTNIDSNFDWSAFLNEMDGATVVLTVSRSGANVTVRCDITPAVGSTARYETFTKTCGDGTQAIRVYLNTEQGHLDILPETATISDVAWSTFASDYNLDFSQAESGLTAYTVTGHSGTAITKEAVTGIVPAGTPLLLNGTASTSYTIPVATSAGTAPTENKLVRGTGAAVSAPDGKTAYVLSKDGTKAVFKKIVSDPATVAANMAYLLFNEVIAARSIDIDGDGTTGIQNLKVGKEDNVYYDLQGRRVLYPKKGLYIVNGKKVIINK